jgi:hypothetical protein
MPFHGCTDTVAEATEWHDEARRSGTNVVAGAHRS